MEKIELSLAAEHIEDYCNGVECDECAVRELCDALDSNLTLADQIRRVAED